MLLKLFRRSFILLALALALALATPALAEPVILADGQIYNVFESGIFENDDGVEFIGVRFEYAASNTSEPTLVHFADDAFEAEAMFAALSLNIDVVVISLNRSDGNGGVGEQLIQVGYVFDHDTSTWTRENDGRYEVLPSTLYPTEPVNQVTLRNGTAVYFEPAVFIYEGTANELLVITAYVPAINESFSNAGPIIEALWNEVMRDQPILSDLQEVRFEVLREPRRSRFHMRYGFSEILVREGTGVWPLFNDLEAYVGPAGGED